MNNEVESMPTLTVTAKGQITLKQDLLRHLNVAPGQKVEVDKLPNGRLVVGTSSPKHSIAEFSGSLARKGGPKAYHSSNQEDHRRCLGR